MDQMYAKQAELNEKIKEQQQLTNQAIKTGKTPKGGNKTISFDESVEVTQENDKKIEELEELLTAKVDELDEALLQNEQLTLQI